MIQLEALTINLLKILDKKKIYFFSVNTKYMSSRELKTLKFSRVHNTSENSDVFNILDKIDLAFT